MTTALQQLPVGIQSFAKLREIGYLYVDKTDDIHRLVTTNGVVFLSRPRRFGKSLLLSTIEELFKGNEPLFRGLAVHDKWNWDEKCPVIRIDMSGFKYSTLEEFDRRLTNRFIEMAEQYGVTLTEPGLAELIRKLRAKTEKRIVVLIDEYDILMLDAINDMVEFEAARIYLQRLYRPLKTESEHLRFVFLTGVSRFSGVSIFSGLNNLKDITLNPQYATICGYTQSELENCFAGHIAAISKAFELDGKKMLEETRTWYNGYSWDGKTSVYNPHSILRHFDEQIFDNFWFSSGTPSFLTKLSETDSEIYKLVDSEIIHDLAAASMDPQNPDWTSLLFQTGYLTIKKVQNLPSRKRKYTLDFPNTEVKDSFLGSLLKIYSKKKSGAPAIQAEMMKEDLVNGDIVSFETNLRSLLAEIPYQLTSKETESHYHVIMIVWLHMLGFKVKNELPTDKGRIDAVLELDNQVFIIEIKLSHTATEADKEKLFAAAFAQIKAKGYADAYMGKPGKVSQLALAFYDKNVACKLEMLKEK